MEKRRGVGSTKIQLALENPPGTEYNPGSCSNLFTITLLLKSKRGDAEEAVPETVGLKLPRSASAHRQAFYSRS